MIFLVDQARSLHEVHAVLQERYLHQEVLDGFTLTAQDLVQKVVHHIMMTAAERRNEVCYIVTA